METGLPANIHSNLPALPPRDRDAHKGAFGRVLIIAGSQGMAGAAALAGMAALRCGAGLVRIATAAGCQPTVAQFEPCYTTVALAEDGDGRIGLDALPRLREEVALADAVALGPGIGQSDEVSSIVLELCRSCELPMVVDADALNALAVSGESLQEPADAPWGPRLWTPHPGEYQRLTGIAPGEAQRDHAVEYAQQQSVTLLLKGAHTLITEGGRTWLNSTGNPGMATGGSGDVLSGVLATLLAQGLSTWDAGRLGAHLHGLAGDMAAAELGEMGLIASDLIDWLPRASKRLDEGE